MSYDLAFWADTRDVRPAPEKIYLHLQEGLLVDELGPFEAQSALSALEPSFPGIDPTPNGETGVAFWESPDSMVSFEFSWSSQHMVATARGNYTNDQVNKIIDACTEVGGGRLYDPQTGERFDSV